MTDQAKVIEAMMAYYQGDPKRIHHFMKVYGLAKTIGELENLDEVMQKTLEISAITHDIGIKVSEEKYGSCGGKYQEQEGPNQARTLLTRLNIDESVISRCEWLIAHHHTYVDIKGIDYQILVEADFLVNAYEDQISPDGIKHFRDKIFKTVSGIQLLNHMYQL